MNGFDQAPVTIRPMLPEDLQALAGWERHADPAFRSYDVGPLSAEQSAEVWRALSDPPCRRPYVASLGASWDTSCCGTAAPAARSSGSCSIPV
jgi:hypothetical protein